MLLFERILLLDTKPLEHMYDRWSQVADTAVCSHQTSASLCFRSWPCTSEHLALVGSVCVVRQ